MTDAFHGEKEKENSTCFHFRGALMILKAEETDSGLLWRIFLSFSLSFFSFLPLPAQYLSHLFWFFFFFESGGGKTGNRSLILKCGSSLL